MVYARLASGYRAGGPNAAPGAPHEYSPDKTQNYELGMKGDFLDHSLSLDASLYYINWKDIQLSLLTPNFFGYNGNGSRAKSQGIEVSAESRPLTDLTIAAWIAFSDAHLTEALPTNNAIGAPGDKLPYSNRFSGNFSVQQDFPLWRNAKGFVGGAVSYVGNREGEFASIFSVSPQRQVFPAYARTDLRAGVKYDSWSMNLYVNNVADRRGILSGGLNAYPPYAFNYIQPRAIGVSFAKTF
jgi:outer membrane receptor protein involved in Fe transport